MSLRIAVFTDSYLPYNSGVVHSIEVLDKELRAMGHEVFIFAPKYPGYQNKEKNSYRFFSLPFPTNADYYLAIPMSRQLKDTLYKIKPDIIHVHQPFSLGWTGMHYAWQLGIPLVYTCHTLYEYYSHYIPLPQNIARTLIKRTCVSFGNKCDIIITPTNATKNYLKNLGINKQFKVIPTGIKSEEFNLHSHEKGWLRKNYNIGHDEQILLCIGRLGKEKNTKFVLECFYYLCREHPDIRLVLTGTGPQEKELKNWARKNKIEDKVIFTGLLPKKEVIKCYYDSDIFVFASTSETQGLVLPEAKTAGLPVVAVKAYGTYEMVENGIDGFLTDLSREEFISKIRLLLKNKDLRFKMSQRALVNSEKFSSRNYAAEALKTYYSLVNNEKKASAINIL